MFALAACLDGVNAQPDKKGKDDKDAPNLYPVEVGNTWRFKVTVAGMEKTITTKIAKHEMVDGKKLARLESPDTPATEHLIQTDKGVFRHRFNGAEVSPPFQLIAYPPKVGAKWKGEFTVQNAKSTYDGEVQAEETIEVPAGKFKTVKVQVNLVENGQKVTVTYWFAKDIGFVKEDVTVGGNQIVLLELEKFERRK
jgi:hypothetical protein